MEFTRSFENHVPADIAARYTFVEVRNAAAVLRSAAPEEFNSLMNVLRRFTLTEEHLLTRGGNEGLVAKSLNKLFRTQNWLEARCDVTSNLVLTLKGAGTSLSRESNQTSDGYLIDNFRGRVALDVEWNAKDGNLDRDLAAYRALYDLAEIDGAVIVTRTHHSLRDHARSLALAAGWEPEDAMRLLSTTTTTNLSKVAPRLSRGDAGGCPVLVIAIGPETMAPSGLTDG